MTEQVLQQTLEETTSFGDRQELLKELWRLNQQKDDEEPKRELDRQAKRNEFPEH